MASIKHIAIRTPAPEKTAAFYKKVFGLEEGATPTNQRVDMVHGEATDTHSYYELKYRGPDRQIIDVTESGWIRT